MTRQDRRLEAGLLVLLFLVWLATWLPRLQGPIDLRWDAAVYYTLGTSLGEGKGYRLLNEPGEIAAIQYPPGLPAIIAVHQRVLGTSDPVLVGIALRRFYLLVSGLYVFAVYWLLKRSFGPPVAAIGAAMCALSMTVVWVSDRAYSEVPFLLATTTFLLLVNGNTVAARTGAAASAIVAFLLRTVGAALLLAWIVEAGLARQWKQFIVRLLVALIAIVSWQGYVWHVERSPAYRSPVYPYQRAPYLMYNVSYTTNASLRRPFFPEHGRISSRDLAIRFLTNVSSVPTLVGEVLSTTSDNWYSYLEPIRRVPLLGLAGRWRAVQAGLTLLGILTLAGLWVHFRNHRQHDVRMPLIAIVYLAAVCAVTVNEEFGRYLTGIQPILIALFFTTMLATPLPAGAARIRYLLFGAVVLTIALGELTALRLAYASGMSSVTHGQWRGHDVSYRMFSYDDTYRAFDDAIEWLGAHAAPGATIASSQPHWVYIRTGRRAVMPPFERDVARQQALLDSVPVGYVIVDSNGFSATREYSLPALRDDRRWERVYRSTDGTTEVYKRRPEASGL